MNKQHITRKISRLLGLVLIFAWLICLFCACSEQKPTSYQVTDMQGENGLDFIIDFPADHDVTILQFADIQLLSQAGARNEVRKDQISNAFFSNLPADFEYRTWRYMDEAVEKAKPDLIVLTGDNIYGEMDDSGELWLMLIAKLDSYGIPWCTAFGNHDNESGKGVMWQIKQLEASKYCIFRQGEVSGNSNYNLLVRQGGEAKFLLYMMDSNGCVTVPHNPGEGIMPDNVDIDKIEQNAGFRADQVMWMTESAKSIHSTHGKVPALIFYHIPVYESLQAVLTTYPSASSFMSSSMLFIPNQEGDFGMATEEFCGVYSRDFWQSAKDIGCTGMFVGHQHKVATSIVCDGIRVTYGLKTGTCAYHDPVLLGATKITLDISNRDFAVEYLYTDLTYTPQ